MPNIINAAGLQVATQAELVQIYTDGFKAIYGNDIDLSPTSPDAQWMMITIQAVLDLQDLLVQINNMFDPDNAIGVLLDQRVAINGIQRLAGTFTVTPVTLVTSQSINLYGLDQTTQPVYTVSDNAGNQWQLQSSHVGLAAGTNILNFQAAVTGARVTIPNTIINQVTIVLGVTSVNNPTIYTTLGTNEETDAQLKIRRQISVSLPSQGYLVGLLAALKSITGVTFAYVEENNTGSTNGDGVPGHSIWVIVAGSGAAASIAQAIYNKRNAGCGMYNSGGAGAHTFDVVQVDGSSFPVLWDDVVTTPLFAKFTAASLDKINPPNVAAIRTTLPSTYLLGPAEQANVTTLGTYIQDIDANTFITSAGFSLTSSGSYTNTKSPATKNLQFVLSSADTIILPIIVGAPEGVLGIGYNINGTSGVVTNTTLAIITSGTFTFQGYGGFSTYTYSIATSTGGTINSTTGVYVAGTAGTDTITITDAASNTATCTVTVS